MKKIFILVFSILMIMSILPFEISKVEAESIPELVKIAEGGQLTEIGTAIKNGKKYMHLYDNDMTQSQAINYAKNYIDEIKKYSGTGNWGEYCQIVYAKSSNDRSVYYLIRYCMSTEKQNEGWVKGGWSNQGTAKEYGSTFNLLFYNNNEYKYSFCSDTTIGAVYFFGTVEDYPEYEWNEVTIDSYSLSISSGINETNAKVIAGNKITEPTGNEYIVFDKNGRQYKYLTYIDEQWTYTSDNQKYMYELRNDVANNSKKVYVIGYNYDLDSKYQNVTLQEITTNTRNISLFDSSMSATTAKTLIDDYIDQNKIDFGNYKFTEDGVQKTFKNEIQVYYSINSDNEYIAWRHDSQTKTWEDATLYTSPESVMDDLNQGTPDGKQIFYDYKYYVLGTVSGLKETPTISKISYNTKSYTLQNNFYVSEDDAINIAQQAVIDGKLTQNDILVYNYNAYYNDLSGNIVTKGTFEYVYYENGQWKVSNTGGTGKNDLISYIALKEVEGKSYYILGTATSYEDGEIAKYLNATITYDKKTGTVTVTNAAANPKSYTFKPYGANENITRNLFTSYELRKNDTYNSVYNPNGDYYSYLIGKVTHLFDTKYEGTVYYAQLSFTNAGFKTLESNASSFTINASDYNDVDKADLQIVVREEDYVGYDDINGTKSYAVYQYQYFALPNKITFNLNGGKIGDSSDEVIRYIVQGTNLDKDSLELAADPSKDNCEFIGWYDAATGGNKVSTLLNRANTTLYAQYKQIITDDMLEYSGPTSLVYDGNDKTSTVTVKSGIIGLTNDDITVNYYTDEECTQKITGNPKDAGTYYVAIDIAQTDTYAAYSARKVGSFTITKADKSVPTTPVGVDATVYDANDGKITGVDSTMEYKLKDSSQYAAITGESLDNLACGTYCIRYAENKNYIASNDVEITIGFTTKATLKADDFTLKSSTSLTYDGNEKPVNITTSKIGVGSAITIKYYKGTEEVVGVPKDVGTYVVKVDVTEGQNYQSISDLTDATWTFEIVAKDVTIKANNNSKICNADEPELTATVTGLIGDDTVVYTLNRDVGYIPGNYTINVNATEYQGNYHILSETGIFTITTNGKEIVINADSASKAYDGSSLTCNTYTYTGIDETKERIEVTIYGSITDIGVTANKVTTYKIYDKDDNDITVGFVNVKTNDGYLAVTSNENDKDVVHFNSEYLAKIYRYLLKYVSADTARSIMIFNLDDIDQDHISIIKTFAVGKEILPIDIKLGFSRGDDYQEINDIYELTDKTINACFEINFNFASKTNIQVFRAHRIDESNTDIVELTTTPNDDGEYIVLDRTNNKIIVYAGKYSTYAVTYDVIKHPVVNTGTNDSSIARICATATLLGCLVVYLTKKKKQH